MSRFIPFDPPDILIPYNSIARQNYSDHRPVYYSSVITQQKYFEEMPIYPGPVITPMLKRSTQLTHRENTFNFFNFSEFLYQLFSYGIDNQWVLACLDREFLLEFGVKDIILCKKKILCKKINGVVVFIISVTGSNKKDAYRRPINDLFKNRIFFYRRISSGDHVINHVRCFNFERVDETQEFMGNTSFLTLEYISKLLSDRFVEYDVIDPNKVTDRNTVVDFSDGSKKISEIDNIIQEITAENPLAFNVTEEPSLKLPYTDSLTEDSRVMLKMLEKRTNASPSIGGNGMKKIKSKFQKRRRSRRYRLNTTRKLKKRARKTSRRRRVHSYKK